MVISPAALEAQAHSSVRSARPEHPLATLILAAGDSHRMGRPKALLKLGGLTFLDKIAADYLRLSCQPIAVVVGRQADKIRAESRAKMLQFVDNPSPDLGALSSVKVGVNSLPQNCQAFFLHPVDHPLVNLKTLEALLAQWRGDVDQAIKPVFQGRGGHPLLLGRSWIELIQNWPQTSTLRELLRTNLAHVLELSVSDPGILQNINKPADLDGLPLTPPQY